MSHHSGSHSRLSVHLVLVLSAFGLAACGDDGGGSTVADVPSESVDATPDPGGDATGPDGLDVLPDAVPDNGPDVADDAAPEPGDATPDVPADAPADVPAEAIDDATDAAEVTPPPGPFAMLELESAVALTPDGGTALLWTYTTGDFALYDTVTGQLSVKGVVGDPMRNVPTALSPSLHVTALHGEPVQAGLWSEATGWRDLGSLFDPGCINDPGPPVMGDLSSAWDVSDDGHVVVGLAWDGCATVQAFRWTDVSGVGVMTGLSVLGKTLEGSGQKAPNNRATVVSGDGRIAAGWAQNGPADRSPAIWNEDGSGFLLEPANENDPGEVKAISADGTRVIGDWAGQGFVWTEATGVTRFAASDSPFDTVVANAMTATGSRVFGTIVTFDPDLLQTTQEAFVWSPHDGVKPLRELVAAAGIELPAGATLTNVLGVSDDGSVVLGSILLPAEDAMGWPVQKAFVLKL